MNKPALAFAAILVIAFVIQVVSAARPSRHPGLQLKSVTREIYDIIWSRKWFRVWGSLVALLAGYGCIKERSLTPLVATFLLVAWTIGIVAAFWGAFRWARNAMALRGIVRARADVEEAGHKTSQWAAGVLDSKRKA